MKKIVLCFIFLNSIFLIGQKKKKYNPVFFDLCTNKIIKPEYEIDSFPGLNNKFIMISLERKYDWSTVHFEDFDSKKDTIFLPRLILSKGTELHSRRWTYLKCDRIAQNLETEYYKNGKKKIEGKFVKGKPLEIKEYNKFGKLYSQTFYNLSFFRPQRINFYDENKDVVEYEIYKYRKRKTIIRRYNKYNKLISKEIEKH